MILLILFCLWLGQGQQVETAPTYQATAQNEQASSNQASPAVKPPESAAQANISPNDATPTTEKIKRAEWVAIFINGFIALVIFWQAWIYNQQRKLMNRQVQNATISERAYIGIESLKFITPLVAGHYPTLRVIFVNGGRTPAWEFVAYCRMVVSIQSASETAAQFPLDADPIQLGTFVPSGARKRVEFPNLDYPVTAELVSAITNGLIKLFVLGEARFRDFQGDPQTFTFRAWYDPSDGGFADATD